MFTKGLIAALTLSACSAFASASTITINSNSSDVFYYGYEAPGSNTVHVASSDTTYNIGTGGVWANPIGSSSWVSMDPQNYPGGSSVEAAGTYIYYALFTDLTPGTSTGTISVLADDTVSILLNNTLIASAASATPAPNCTVGTPNCKTVSTFALTGFDLGTNYIAFEVNQDFGSATGVDFVATVNTAAAPEPSSLMLLATGLTSAAGLMRRRFLA